MSDKPFIYVCSPYRGDIEKNTALAREYCRQVYEAGYSPIAPHLFFPQFLHEEIPDERRAGMHMGESLFQQCRALVVCGNVISEGMKAEIALAKRFRVPVLTLDAFQPEKVRDIPANVSVLAQAVQCIKQYNTKAPADSGIHVFIANPKLRDPMGHVDTMLKLPVSAGDFNEALCSIGTLNHPPADYYFHSISTSDVRIRGFLPRAIDENSFNELNYLAANLYGIGDRSRKSFAVATKKQSVKEQIVAAAKSKPCTPDRAENLKPSKSGPER